MNIFFFIKKVCHGSLELSKFNATMWTSLQEQNKRSDNEINNSLKLYILEFSKNTTLSVCGIFENHRLVLVTDHLICLKINVLNNLHFEI